MYNLQNIVASFANAPGFDKDKFLEAHRQPAVNSFRINRKKIKLSPFENAESIHWCEDGFYLKDRPKYALHPYWHGGAFYVQEASSMFLQFALKKTLSFDNSLCVLDACAAPGGKSTLISSLLNKESVLVSNEVIRSRVNVLQENMIKWGAANTIITSSDSQQFKSISQVFDVIIVDAPCSGSGLFRKDPNAINEWSEGNIKLCGERQERISNNLLPSLKCGGVLIYSTCSYSIEENEKIVDQLCENHEMEMISIEVPEEWNIINSKKGCYRFYPYMLKGEGFFMALLRKKGETEKINSNSLKTLKTLKPDVSFTSFLEQGFNFFIHNNSIFAASNELLQIVEVLKQGKINLIQCGVETGELKGSKFIPAHALALNEALSKNIESIDVDEETALRYLRKETISIHADTGYKIIQYKNVNLGWVNVLQNRVNNMYPTTWRLMT